ncbi:hypothetical protein [Myroides phaeus]|uniref:Lipoprotein n=1 Tax=Myroides phaeus TaxID=702745 RepID=A0A1G8AYS2_9FLAO|nr:hypothetical protein [Myroides phaeus]MEC4115739.1 hypothetical protein [Myroides phaeus]SDH26024.1 hypothetical protein SAMN05421818_10124 [Myroides phaeus]
MKKSLLAIFLMLFSISLLTTSCKDEEKFEKEQEIKISQHRDSVFAFLKNNWKFSLPKPSNELKPLLDDWKAWQEFKQELSLKPVTTIGAFQKKADVLTQKLSSLSYQKMPEEINLPDVKARITLLQTSLNNLHLFIIQEPIEIDRLDNDLKQVNNSIKLLFDQMEENLIKNRVPKEIGEEEMLEAISTERRANPTTTN